MSNALDEKQLAAISDAIIAGRKIEAIKEYRELTGTGLKEAKEAIESITQSLAADHPELAKQNKSGCASMIVIGACLTGCGLYELLSAVA